jgi:hypothetical protein
MAWVWYFGWWVYRHYSSYGECDLYTKTNTFSATYMIENHVNFNTGVQKCPGWLHKPGKDVVLRALGYELCQVLSLVLPPEKTCSTSTVGHTWCGKNVTLGEARLVRELQQCITTHCHKIIYGLSLTLIYYHNHHMQKQRADVATCVIGANKLNVHRSPLIIQSLPPFFYSHR